MKKLSRSTSAKIRLIVRTLEHLHLTVWLIGVALGLYHYLAAVF